MQGPCGNPLPYPRVARRKKRVAVVNSSGLDDIYPARAFAALFVPWLLHEYPGRARYVMHVLGCSRDVAEALLSRVKHDRHLTPDKAERLAEWCRRHAKRVTDVAERLEAYALTRAATARRGHKPLWIRRYDRLQRAKEAAARGEPEKPR